MICERCALMPECPPEVRGPYGRACWLAFGEGRPEPDCKRFVARNDRYWPDRQEWSRARRVRNERS
jgi:hypothetical protein